MSTQIFLLLQHTFSSLDSFSYQQSQSNITGYSDDSIDAQVLSRACVTTLKSIRSENEFNLFWNKVKEFSEKHKIDEPHFSKKKKKKKKKKPNCYMIGKAAGEYPEKV